MICRFNIDPLALALPFTVERLPIGLVNLDSTSDFAGPVILPAFPIVGIGDRRHPLASFLDTVVEVPATIESLVMNVCANPVAAAVAVQTLRMIDTLTMEHALVAESIAYGILQGGQEHIAWRAARRPNPTYADGAVRVSRDGAGLDICLDRLEANNAIDRPMRDILRTAFEIAALDPGIDSIVLRSTGRAFSIGADLAEFGTVRDPPTAHNIRMESLPAHAIARCADRLKAHIHGACVGSALEMAAFAHRITASRRAWFQLPELAMGLIPGAGGCVSVARRIGRQRLALMVLSGRRIDVRMALDWGLVDEIVDD